MGGADLTGHLWEKIGPSEHLRFGTILISTQEFGQRVRNKLQEICRKLNNQDRIIKSKKSYTINQ